MTTEIKKFVPVMITPFNQKLNIDWNGLSSLIEFYLEAGVKGLFANCLSSEMYSITKEERIELIRFIVNRASGRVPVVATGSFGLTSGDKSESVKKTFDTGVDSVILITSHFAGSEQDDEQLIYNFEELFRLTGTIPLGLYECPAPYKRILPPTVFEILLRSNRLTYHKDTSLDIEQVRQKINIIKKEKNSQMELYDAHTPNGKDSLQAGAKGMSAIAGNFYPEILTWLCDHVTDSSKQELVNWLQNELNLVDPLIHEGYPLSSKYFLEKRGLPIRIISRVHPLELTKGQQEKLDEIYDGYLGWCERLELSPVNI